MWEDMWKKICEKYQFTKKKTPTTTKKPVIITRYKGTKSHGLPGKKRKQDVGKLLPQYCSHLGWLHCPGDKDKMAEKPPSPDHVGERENKLKKTTHSNWSSMTTELPLPSNNNQWETRPKKKKPGELLLSKTSQMLLSHLLCATGQSLSHLHRQCQLELVQQLELVEFGVQESHSSWHCCLEWLQWKKSPKIMSSPAPEMGVAFCGQKKGVMKFLKGFLKEPWHLLPPQTRGKTCWFCLCPLSLKGTIPVLGRLA